MSTLWLWALLPLSLAGQSTLFTCMSSTKDYVVGAKLPMSGLFFKDSAGAWRHAGYNHPLFSQRVHDILTAVAFVRGNEKTKQVDLVGWDAAGPWVMLARALCGDAVARTAADVNGFTFEKVKTTDDPMMLPGAVKYGGLYALTGLAAPGELYLNHMDAAAQASWLPGVYGAASAAGNLVQKADKVEQDGVADWLLR